MPQLQAPPRLRRRFRMLRIACLTVSFAAAMTITARGGAQQASGDYATDLGYVYAGYQEIVALKEACDEAVPGTRAASGRAFSEWQARHKELLAELKRRVTSMVRLASSDEREYARNLGKYEGAILLSREEHKMSFLALGTDKLRAQCERIPELLKGPQADLNVIFAGELKTIRKHK
jgi:hypothetical protein